MTKNLQNKKTVFMIQGIWKSIQIHCQAVIQSKQVMPSPTHCTNYIIHHYGLTNINTFKTIPEIVKT